MKNLILKTFPLFIGLSLSSCGLEGDSNFELNSNESSSSQTNTIQGKSAEDYYNQFLFKEKDQNGRYHFAQSVNFFLLSGNLYGKIDLAMFSDKSFKLHYSEWQKSSYDSYTFDFEETLVGSWKISGTKLLIGDLAEGNGMEYNGSSSIGLTFSNSIKHERLVNTVPFLIMFSSSESPF